MLLTGISVCYFLVTLALSNRKLLSVDEFFTLYLGRLSPRELWAALLTGGDQHPPLFYLMHHLVLSVLDENAFALRLPPIFGFLLMMLCVYKFVACRTSVAYGLAAMLIPLATIAHEYAFEARGYAPLLGFFALAALCWQQAGWSRRRRWGLFGLAVALTAGVCSHYYTLFLIPTIAIAEITRSLRSKSWRPGVWLAMSVPLIPLVAFLPVIEAGRTFAATFWGKVSALEIYSCYDNLVGSAIICLLLCFAAGGLYRVFWRQDGKTASDFPRHIPIEEIVLGLGVACAPVIVYLFGKTLTGVFVWRYAIGGIVGMAILFGFACFGLFRGRATAAWLIIFIIAASFGVKTRLNMQKLSNQRLVALNMIRWTRGLRSKSEPLVIGNSWLFYTLTYYSPAAEKASYVYLADPKRSLQYVGHDTPDRSLSLLSPWFGLNVKSYASYLDHIHRSGFSHH